MSSSKLLSNAPIASIESLEDLSEIANDDPNININNINNKNNNNNNNSNNTSQKKENYTVISTCIDPDFEYKGYYKFGRILGKGSFGTVIECFRKIDEKPIALKFFKHKAIHKWIPEYLISEEDMDMNLFKYSEFFSLKNRSNNKQQRLLPSEVACLLRSSKIDGVVKILDYIPASEEVILDEHTGSSSDSSESDVNKINDDTIIGIVLERDPNETCLFDYLIQRDYLLEAEARVIMKQIVNISLDLLHNGILHGDLKSENILINPMTKKIKIIDFGSAQLVDLNTTSNSSSNRVSKTNGKLKKCNTQLVRTFRGTNLYKPPEFIIHHCFYPRPSTVWTFGIILYDMVCGHFPFDTDSDVLIHQDKDIEFTRDNLSENFKDLVKKCLAFYVADRIVIEKVINHPWLNQ